MGAHMTRYKRTKRNKDRALWAGLAVTKFAEVTGFDGKGDL